VAIPAAIVAVVLIVGFDAAPASAHAQLESTNPATNTTYGVASPPRKVTLHFGESVGVKLGGVRLYDQRGQLVNTGSPTHPSGDGSTVEATLPHLGTGTYVVTWRVISADTHPVAGAFTFSVGTKRDVNALTTRLLSAQGGSKTVGVIYGAVRFGVYASVLTLIGGLVFLLFLWPEGRRSRRARLLLWGAWWVGLVVTIVGFAVEGIYAAAFPLRDLLNSSVLTDTWHSHYGEYAAVRVGALVLAIPVMHHLFARSSPDEVPDDRGGRAGARMLTVVVAGLLTASLMFVMHATTGRWVPFALVADAFHIVGASIWLGGLVVLAVAVLPAADDTVLDRVVPRFSWLAMVCIVAVVASGTFQAIRQVGSISALRSTDYGQILIAKVLAFVVLVVVAAFSLEVVNRWYRLPAIDEELELVASGASAAESVAMPPNVEPAPLKGGVAVLDEVGDGAGGGHDDDDGVAPGLDGVSARRRLRRTVGVEVAIAVVILVITALLVDARPAYEATNGPVSVTLKTSKLWFNVTIAPGTTGPNAVHLTASTVTGGIASPLQMSMELTNAAHDVAPLKVPFLVAGPGHDLASGFQIPFSGQWRVTVTALVDPTDEVTATQVVTIR
jgi:copper transport protein